MLIDFDAHFSSYMEDWLRKHQEEYGQADQIEELLPELYLQFCELPADWLGGLTPQGYFQSINDAHQLIRLMEQYLLEEIALPDLLLERLEDLGSASEKPLFELLTDDTTMPEARMIAINLLGSLASVLPMQTYIAWQLDREATDDLADAALDSLEGLGDVAVAPMLDVLPLANDIGKEALLGVLSRFPGTPEVFEALTHLLLLRPDRQAVLAAYLGRFGDERAVPLLAELAQEDGLAYLDYIELRAAIEALGGEAPERTFEDDPQYEAMQGLM